jgi:hypothetical protein
MYPVTFDCVTTPGYRKCRITDPDDFASKNENYAESGKMGKEGFGFESFDWIINNPENQIKSIFEEYGKESVIIQDLFNLDMAKAKICLSSDNNQVTFSTEDGKDVTIHVNPYIFNQVMNKK